MLEDHKKAKKHRQNEKAYKAAHPETEPSSIFKSIQFDSEKDGILSDLQKSL